MLANKNKTTRVLHDLFSKTIAATLCDVANITEAIFFNAIKKTVYNDKKYKLMRNLKKSYKNLSMFKKTSINVSYVLNDVISLLLFNIALCH